MRPCPSQLLSNSSDRYGSAINSGNREANMNLSEKCQPNQKRILVGGTFWLESICEGTRKDSVLTIRNTVS
jgi:hypothetical protein